MIVRLLLYILWFVAPFVLFGAYKMRQINRLMRAGDAMLPFAAEPMRAPGALLRRFTPEEGVYVRQQFKLALGIYLVVGWTCMNIFSVSTTGMGPNAHLWSDKGAMDWLLFLESAAHSPQYLAMMMFGFAFVAIAPMRLGADARFYRTRPLTIGFIFRWRVLPLLGALLLGAATGWALGFATFAAVNGAAWRHLPSVIPRQIGVDDDDVVQRYADLLQTSVMSLFVSFLTTTGLVFSALVAVFTVPARGPSRRPVPLQLAPLFVVVLMMPLVLSFLPDTGTMRLPRWLFIYTVLGPPPPYAFAVVPIALSLCLLLVGRRFVERCEL